MLIFILSSLACSEKVTLELNQGFIVGETNDKVEIYRGVPFAEPPVGNLRKSLQA